MSHRRKKNSKKKLKQRNPTRPNQPSAPSPRHPLVPEWDVSPCLVHFIIPSPFAIPILQGSSFMLERSESVEWLTGAKLIPTDAHLQDRSGEWPRSQGLNFVSFRFYQSDKPRAPDLRPLEFAGEVASYINPNIPSPKRSDGRPAMEGLVGSEGHYSDTVIEAVTPLLAVYDSGSADPELSVNAALDRVFDSLQTFLMAYRVITDDVFIGPINLSTIFPLMLWTTRTPTLPPVWGGLGVHVINVSGDHLPIAKPVLSREATNQVAVALSRIVRDDPFVTAADFRWKARRSLVMERDTRAAVIHAQTASEMFLDHVLLSLAWETGIQPVEAASWFDATDRITRRVPRWYSQLLPGNWNCADPQSELGEWTIRVCHVRNRVVHAGYEPTLTEADQAIAATEKLVDLLVERLLARKTIYPRTLLLLVGVPGLEARGALTKKLREFIQIADSEPDWIRARSDWFEQFRAART